MSNIVIKKNKSFRASIIEAFQEINWGENKAYQLRNLNSMILYRNDVKFEGIFSKIRVFKDKDKVIISEFTFQLKGETCPTKHLGDYELLEDFVAEYY